MGSGKLGNDSDTSEPLLRLLLDRDFFRPVGGQGSGTTSAAFLIGMSNIFLQHFCGTKAIPALSL